MKDHKWRSNVLWYDYLQSRKTIVNENKPTLTTIDNAPIPSYQNSFEATNLLEFLHGHFSNHKEHFIASMILVFNESFVSEYVKPGNNKGNDIEDHSNPVLSALVDEIKAFVMLVLQSMIHYYGGVVSKIIEEKPGEMYDLILEEVFTYKLQNCLLSTFTSLNQEYEKNYREKIEQYSDLTCADLGIEKKFQIDSANISGQNKGYDKAINKLRELEINYSPLRKLGIIISTTRLICECVDDYWKDDQTMNKENLVIDADQILSIFLYIVIKAKVWNLKGHVGLIYDFGRKIVQNGQMGYYVTTIEACIMQVENMGSELLTRLKDYSDR